MLKNLIKYFCIITIFIGCSGSKNSEGKSTTSENQNPSNSSSASEEVLSNLDENTFTNQQVNFEIKKMFAEINYLKEQLNELDIKSSLYADPFSVYNKEIILNNGSSIFCKILSQDDENILVETLIGNLTIKRTSVVRIVENIIVLEEGNSTDTIIEISQENEEQILDNADLINNRKNQSSASVIVMGDIQESKDKSGNTIFTGQLKNIGTERADLVRIDFILRKNFQGDVERLTAYAKGSSHVFKDSGIISDSSIKPGAVGEFTIIIPSAIGNFIGYSYELHWDQYE